MHFSYAYIWDKGDYYEKNQDSFILQTVLTGNGPYGYMAVCDGVGGLQKGEFASGYVVEKSEAWFFENALPMMCKGGSYLKLQKSFLRFLEEVHKEVRAMGERKDFYMGTTMTAFILAPQKYYVFHVGDSFCCKISRGIRPITSRQTNQKGELLSALGVGECPKPIMKKGTYGKKDCFLLGSDGFARCLTNQSITAFRDADTNEKAQKLLEEVIKRGRMRGERDNCTGILLRRKC